MEAGEGEQLQGSTPGTSTFLGPWATTSRATRPWMPWPSWFQALALIFVLQHKVASEPVLALAPASHEGEQEAQ